jgi:hypothetical protein
MQAQLKSIIVTGLILLLPMSSFAGTSAIVTRMGANNANGDSAPGSYAIFAGDVVATLPDSAATINSEGSMVLVQPDSSVQFQSNAVSMEHGGVVVTTWKGMAVKVGRFTIAPAASGPAKFEASESGGVIQIAARQGAVNINDGVATTLLAEGQQTTREELAKGQGAPPAASGNSLHASHKKLAAIIGGAAGGTAAGVLLATRGKSQPVSPAVP